MKDSLGDRMSELHEKALNLIGQRFDKLIVTSFSHKKLRNTQKSRDYYWNCKCDCGTATIISTNKLRMGQKSCGCSLSTRLNKGQAFLNKKFYGYKRGAKDRNLKFKLSKIAFKRLLTDDCKYCGDTPSLPGKGHEKANGVINVNGIDRIDNSKDYTISNCVTSCFKCNRAKSSMGIEAFIEWIDRLVRFRVNSL